MTCEPMRFESSQQRIETTGKVKVWRPRNPRALVRALNFPAGYTLVLLCSFLLLETGNTFSIHPNLIIFFCFCYYYLLVEESMLC